MQVESIKRTSAEEIKNALQQSTAGGFKPALAFLRRLQTNCFSKYKKSNDNVEIRVKDNGNNILQKVLEKIFSHSLLPNQQGRKLAWDYH